MKRRNFLSSLFALAAAPLALKAASVRRLLDAERPDTDITNALQAAAAAGRTVFLPPGTYRLTRTVEIRKPGFRLVGAGCGVTVLEHSVSPAFVTTRAAWGRCWIEHLLFKQI